MATKRREEEASGLQSLQALRLLAENIPEEVFWIRSADLERIIYVSPAFERVWGRKLGKLENLYFNPKEWMEAISLEDREIVEFALKKLAELGMPIQLEYRILHPERGLRWIQDRGYRIYDESSDSFQLLGIASDVTEQKKTFEVLKDSEAKYKKIIETSHEGIWYIDKDYNILFANQRLAEMFGYNSVDEIIGRSVLAAMDEKTIEFAKEKRKSRPKGVTEEYELQLRKKDGTPILVRVAAATIFDSENKPIAALGMINDITEKRKAERILLIQYEVAAILNETKEELQEALKKIMTVICKYLDWKIGNLWMVDSKTKVITLYYSYFANEQYKSFIEEMSKLSYDAKQGFPGQVISAHTQTWKLDTESEEFIRRHAAKESGVSGSVIGFPILYGYETYAVFEFFIGQVKKSDPTILGMFNVIESQISQFFKRLKAEEELKKSHFTLERKVRERTLELENFNKELESFSYSVSHDLRAPLRAIQGFSDALMEDYGNRFDEGANEYYDRIKKAVERMTVLIDSLLDLSRVTRSELHVQEVNLSKIIKIIENELKQNEPERKVDFTVQENLVVSGDEKLLYIVLDNLIRNAWKFTSKKELSMIEFGLEINENNEKVYFIRDNGAGYNMKYKDKLFLPFQRLHHDSEFLGTGVGLATVKRIIERHKGRIWSKGSINEGATFYFTIEEY